LDIVPDRNDSDGWGGGGGEAVGVAADDNAAMCCRTGADLAIQPLDDMSIIFDSYQMYKSRLQRAQLRRSSVVELPLMKCAALRSTEQNNVAGEKR